MLTKFNKRLLYVNILLAGGVLLMISVSAFTGPSSNPPGGQASGILGVANGGTGANGYPPDVANNLGLALSGNNSNISQLTGLTTPLTVSQGGTGTSSLSGILQGNGTGAFTSIVAGTVGNVLTDNGTSWVSEPPSGTTGKFGGTGVTPALNISSGVTTINLNGASYVEEDYKSISITGTGELAFSNPNTTTGTIVALRSQGNVTITSSASRAIDLRGMGGGLGNASVAVGGGGAEGTGSGGGGGGSGSGAGGGGSGQSGGGASNVVQTIGGYGGPAVPYPNVFARLVLPGGNGSGASGGGSGAGGGGGGLGGGALYIECAGAYDFTGVIDASGTAGTNGTTGAYSNYGGSGGGGAGGNILVLYSSLIADSGTYNLAGAAGGSNGGGGGGANGVAVRSVNTYSN